MQTGCLLIYLTGGKAYHLSALVDLSMPFPGEGGEDMHHRGLWKSLMRPSDALRHNDFVEVYVIFRRHQSLIFSIFRLAIIDYYLIIPRWDSSLRIQNISISHYVTKHTCILYKALMQYFTIF